MSRLSHRGESQPADEENITFPLLRKRWLSNTFRNQRARKRISNVQTGEEKRDARRKKLGTFNGVWVPTTLNVLSILMFLRFGFILGQAGILGMLGLLAVSYVINLITTLSVSAISSNGTVRGGGAYYLISRSLGPEFGGSIGLVFYLGFIFNTGMNAVGLVDCVINNFGASSGTVSQVVPESFWLRYLYATVVLVFCTVICLLGSSIFARASNILLAVLLLATFSIPLSALVRAPFEDPYTNTIYTGLSTATFKQNLLPSFTKGASGGRSDGKKNTWQDLFGILFPATAGIFAGASMSGDLKNPSKSIPSGTLNGLLVTFVAYALVILSMGATIARETLYANLNVIQDTNVSPYLILMGEFATSFFSALMGVIGSAKSLQAVARDNIFPGLGLFSQGTPAGDEPTIAIVFTFLLSQLTLLADINTIASFVTMTYLVTFWVTNLACFLLKIGSAPNFRPTFKFFTWWTAGVGAVISLATMFFVDGFYASGVIGVILALFLIIHYSTLPKSWGDVSQSLIYHQVRKYLLRLKQEHVKFWRPQILLLVNDPRRSWKLIQFCNAMKKGGLYILGHIIVTPDFQESFPEVKRQQSAWMKYIDFSRIKAFPHVEISPSIEWGARSIVLSAGLGGMRPNIVVLGFFNMDEFNRSRPLIDVEYSSPRPTSAKARETVSNELPTDSMRSEKSVGAMSYVNILEDLLLCLQTNVAVAKGFDSLYFPGEATGKKYIDLWPVQMCADDVLESTGNILSTNFDTYALILQLGCILNTVPTWKKAFKLRVAVFVEFEMDVQEEKTRVEKLLSTLRIQAEVLVFWLASGDLNTYEVVVNGANGALPPDVDRILTKEIWWTELRDRRRITEARRPLFVSSRPSAGRVVDDTRWPSSTFYHQGRSPNQPLGLRGLLRSSDQRRHSISEAARLGVRLNMRAQRLVPDNFRYGSASELSSEESDSDDVSISSQDSEGGAELTTQPEPVLPKRSSGDNTNAIRDPPPEFSLLPTPKAQTNRSPIGQASSSHTSPHHGPPPNAKYRPPFVSKPSTPHFSCRALPDTQVSADEGPGPSIMFADTSASPRSTGDLPPILEDAQRSLSFNDLPAQGQHIILNELIQKNSVHTAVVFTTLPSPAPGTCKDEQASCSYLEGLEALTKDLPPVLLIHSNSLTVTTSL